MADNSQRTTGRAFPSSDERRSTRSQRSRRSSSLGRIARSVWSGGEVIARPLAAAIGWLAALGTHQYDEDTRRRLKILNLIAYLIAITTLIYAIQHAVLDFDKFAPLIWTNLALVPIAIAVPFSHRISPIAGGIIIVVAEWIALTYITALIGTGSGVHYQFFVAAAAPFVVFGLERIWLVLATVLSGLTLHLVCAFLFPPESAIITNVPELVESIYVQAVITTVALIAAVVWYAFQLVETAKAENERLLRNILPDEIVERLKSNPTDIVADAHTDTAVLFADIAGFVALSKSLGPERVVRLLNELIRAFDALAEHHRVEKIKTIGDAYMAAAGVPTPVERPAVRLTAFALEMIGEAQRIRTRYGLEFELRLGMARGPLMAGVIGTRKFSYDIWGDTVNLAARLENRSMPGRLMICPQCREEVSDVFELEECGEIEIRGVGRQSVWFVVGPKSAGLYRTAGETA